MFASLFSGIRRSSSSRSSKPARKAPRRPLLCLVEHLEDRALLAAVSTDQSDYAPGSTAIFTATDFLIGETVQFHVTRTDGIPDYPPGNQPWYVADGSEQDLDGLANGTVITTWYVDEQYLGASLLLTATGITSGQAAQTTFTDGPEATITSVQPPAAGTYGLGQTLSFIVNFDKNVAVTGTPRIQLTIGSATRFANYVSGAGSGILTFTYTVQAGDSDTNGIASASPIQLNGGTIKTGSNNAILTFTPPNTTGVLVDTVAPTAIATVTALSADTGASSSDFITNTTTQTVSGTFTGTLAAGDSIQISANGGTTWVTATTSAGTWTASGVTLVQGAGSLITRTIDLASNSKAGNSRAYTLDTVAPTITAQRDTAANANGWNNTNVASSYSASDALSGLASPATGAFTFIIEGAAQSHMFTVTDFAGNSASATVSNVNIDKTAPAVSTAAPSATYGAPATLSATASDATSGLAGVTIQVFRASDNALLSSGPATFSAGAWTYSYTPAEASDQYVIATATDNAGLSANSNANFTVAKAVLTVTASSATRNYGQANPAFTASYSGFVLGDTAAVLSGAPGVSSAATPASPVGTYPVVATLGTLAAANYSFAFVDGALTVGSASTTVGLSSSSNPSGTANTVTFTATVGTASAISPAGQVEFFVDGVSRGTASVAAGLASLGVSGLAAGTHSVTAIYSDPAGNFLTSSAAPLSQQVLAPAKVQSIAVNDGRAQRSMVNSLTVTFDRSVTYAAGAFQLVRLPSNTAVNVQVNVAPGTPATAFVLTFDGGTTLADGIYRLSLAPTLIHDVLLEPQELDPVGTTLTFHRLQGDVDGDKDVDSTDALLLKNSYGLVSASYETRWFLDFNASGNVDSADLYLAKLNYGKRFAY